MKRTGRIRYRAAWFGRAVLQFEWIAYDPQLGEDRVWWADAKIAEVTETTP